MKTFLKIAGIIVVLLLVVIAYFAYSTGSQSKFDASRAVSTLIENPPLCAQRDNLLYTADKVEYAVMPGVYSYFIRGDERAPKFTVAVNSDRTICSCQRKENSDEVQFFDYGQLNDKGYIEWDEGKSWPSMQERLNLYNQAVEKAKRENPNVNYVGGERAAYGVLIRNNSLITTIGSKSSLAHAINLPSNGCVTSWLSLYPIDGVTKEAVCGCDGHGVN